MFTFFRAFGQTIGVAIRGVIFENRMHHELALYLDLLEFSGDALSLIEAMRLHLFDAPETIILRHAFTKSIRVIWEVMIGLVGISLFASCFIKGYNSIKPWLPSKALWMAEKSSMK